MFNWASLPTFFAMLLFWLLAAYVLTRSPRSAISRLAVGAQVATACYLLGNGMAANAETAEQWVAWLRPLQWGAAVAPLCWYWLTLALLTDQGGAELARYRRFVGYPLAILIAAMSLGLVIAVYVDDWLYGWSQMGPVASDQMTYLPYSMPNGPLYPGLVALLLMSTVGALTNVLLGWRHTNDPERRHRFEWLLASAVLFIIGANLLGLVNWVTHGLAPAWVGHLILAAAMAVMGWNVAAYSLLFKGQVIRTDFAYFVTALVAVCVAYGLVFLVSGIPYNFGQLQLFMLVLITTILSYALVDLGRRGLDRLFFGPDVQQLRASLAATAQDAALTPNLSAVLAEAHEDLHEVSDAHLVRLTEQSLRRLNNPAALAGSPLFAELPHVLGVALSANGAASSSTPLERARVLREVLIAAIEGLKPADGDVGIGSPGGLQYNIMREEYLQGLLNKQIMARHSLSEGTFHRNRRQAIWTLAQELRSREDRLARTMVPSA